MAAMRAMRHIIAGEAPVQVPGVYKDLQRHSPNFQRHWPTWQVANTTAEPSPLAE